MAGIVELDELLKSMLPEIKSGEYVFCTVAGNYSDYAHFCPLASYGISANVVAAYYHDHIFVQTEKADQALLALKEFGTAEN